MTEVIAAFTAALAALLPLLVQLRAIGHELRAQHSARAREHKELERAVHLLLVRSINGGVPGAERMTLGELLERLRRTPFP